MNTGSSEARVPIPREALRDLLARGWGVRAGALESLPGDVDRNVRVRAADGGGSVLKVSAPGTDPARLEARVAVLGHLARRLSEETVPRVLPTLEGEPFLRATLGGEERLVWRLSWLEGVLLPDSAPHGHTLFRSWGAMLGRVDAALSDFHHPGARRAADPWDPARADWAVEEVRAGGAWEDGAGPGSGAGRRTLLEDAVEGWRSAFLPLRTTVPRVVIHGDGNGHNLLVDRVDHPETVVGLLDFGDMTESCRVVEPALAAAYAALRSDDPLGAMTSVVAGYHGVHPLSEDELAVVYPLARMRLVVSVLHSARRRRERPDDPYVTVSEAPAWRTLGRLHPVRPGLAKARIRVACGLEAVPGAERVGGWLDRRRGSMPRVLPEAAGPPESWPVLDLSVGSRMLGANPASVETGTLEELIQEVRATHSSVVAVGRWDEARPIYRSPLFRAGEHPTDEHRTIHLGLDLFVAAGTEIHAPLAGTVESLGDTGSAKDYGPVLLLRHEPGRERDGEDVPRFWSLWGHLDPEVLERLAPGDGVAAGDLLGRVGAPPRNGDWPPHPHLQLVLDPLDAGHEVPGVAPSRERAVRLALAPNPAALLGLPDDAVWAPRESPTDLLPRRRAHLGPGLSLSYRRPLHLVRGWMQYLYDQDGRAWLDLYNNVPHVGHSHPRVAEAVARQTALLATNTRYLSRVRLEYLERLAELLPEELGAVYLVNSASEANELALRIARAATGRRDVLVQEAGYHGHTTGLIEVSPYKALGPAGEGVPDHVHVVDRPDAYRGRHRGEGAGAAYSADVARRVEELVTAGRPPGAFLAETFPSVGGQLVPPPGYLEGAYRAVRGAGGLVVADEVQTGFGRLGSDAFWGIEVEGVVPDLMVLGKPMGNGFPLAAVAVRPRLAEAFDDGMEFFSTFGGNPVACAAGLAVLDVLRDEELPARAGRTGRLLLEGLQGRAGDHPRVGDLRGRGLFLGMEMVTDREGRVPDGRGARYLVERLREQGILTGTDGPDGNVVKIRGPLCVDEADVDRFLAVVAGILAEPFLAETVEFPGLS